MSSLEVGYCNSHEYYRYKNTPLHVKTEGLAIGGLYTLMVLLNISAADAYEAARDDREALKLPVKVLGKRRPPFAEGSDWSIAKVQFVTQVPGEDPITAEHAVIRNLVDPISLAAPFDEAYFKSPSDEIDEELQAMLTNSVNLSRTVASPELIPPAHNPMLVPVC
jgi:hypothetical protein